MMVKGVSLVACLGVVRSDHKTTSIYSAHWPFLASKRFFESFRIDLFIASAWPFPCEYLGVDLVKPIFHFFEKYFESRRDELGSIVCYDFVWDSMSADDIFPYEVLDLCVFDASV